MKKVIIFVLIILSLGLVHYKSLEIYSYGKVVSLAENEEVCGQGEGCDLSTKIKKGFDLGDQVPNLTLIDSEGNETKLYDQIRGKEKFVLSFTADWCSDCLRQDKKLNEYYDDIKDKYGVAIFYNQYTSRDGQQTSTEESSRKFLDEQDYVFPTYIDTDNKVANKFGGVKATPTNIILDENGIIKGKTQEIDLDILLLDNKETTYVDMKEEK